MVVFWTGTVQATFKHRQSLSEEGFCLVLQPGQVVGIDMEWRPSFGMVGKPRVSLLQIALNDEVFLLDLPRLLEHAETEGGKEKLPHFIQMLYSDAAITKLGNMHLFSLPQVFTQLILCNS